VVLPVKEETADFLRRVSGELGVAGMSEWKGCTLDDVLSFSNGRASPERADDQAYPVYGSNGVIGFAETANSGPDTIVIGRVGSYCGSLYFSKKHCWVTDNAIKATARDGNDPRFLFYLLQTLRLNHWRAGSGQPLLNQTILGSIPSSVPELDEQRAIAHILGTLDNKIELNRLMNETLEAIARAIFKSWFVDFDPVRAKASSEPPESICHRLGLTSEVLDIFPDRFQDSELGGIPEGWPICAVEDLSLKVGMGPFGSNIKVSTFVERGIPVISGEHLNATMLEDTTFNFISAEHADRLSSSNVWRGDIIFTHAGNIGQVSYIPDHSRYERYVLSQRQFFLRCDLSKISPIFMVYFFRLPEGQHKLLANASQVGVPSIARPVSYLKSVELVVPAKALVDQFDRLVRKLHHTQSSLQDEIATLTATRDALLPKLISGKLRVLIECVT
jgi:type I restriction enzyme S subunit